MEKPLTENEINKIKQDEILMNIFNKEIEIFQNSGKEKILKRYLQDLETIKLSGALSLDFCFEDEVFQHKFVLFVFAEASEELTSKELLQFVLKILLDQYHLRIPGPRTVVNVANGFGT